MCYSWASAIDFDTTSSCMIKRVRVEIIRHARTHSVGKYIISVVPVLECRMNELCTHPYTGLAQANLGVMSSDTHRPNALSCWEIAVRKCDPPPPPEEAARIRAQQVQLTQQFEAVEAQRQRQQTLATNHASSSSEHAGGAGSSNATAAAAAPAPAPRTTGASPHIYIILNARI